MEEDILSIEEAARYLRVSDDTIRRAVKNGELKAAKIGNQYRIKKADLDALFKAQKPDEPKPDKPK